MIDLRPAGYVIGWLTVVLGAAMFAPMAADILLHDAPEPVFATSAIFTIVSGGMILLACRNADTTSLTIQQSFVLASGIWLVFPFFAALPFVFGAPRVSLVDGIFEAMSALTTTGATVFSDLESLPPGVKLWRGMLQWFGGLGIVVVAIVFLPTLKVGGMQFFRSEAFDTMGKILPRATEIAASLTSIYLVLTLACAFGYVSAGMSAFDAVTHSLTTVSTGGMANYDASFAAFSPGAQYVAVLFMILAALPFIRYIQLAAGTARPLLVDSQVHGFFVVIGGFGLALALYVAWGEAKFDEPAFRAALFNVTSIGTGTGYASTDYQLWGPFAMAAFFTLGLIGGCSASTACSVKIFRYQLLLSAVAAEVRQLHSPNRAFTPRYQGRRVDADTMSSVMAFFMFFFLALGIVAVALVLLGLDPITAISGAATALANVGPGLGPIIGPDGNFASLSDPAKVVLSVTMLLGRLELLTVLVLFTPSFWRA